MTITTPEQMREAAARLADIAAKTLAKNAPMISRDTGVNQMFSDLASAIRSIPIAPHPATDWTTCAADMLRVWDTWFGGSANGDHAAADRLAIASAFAAQAFEHAASSGITADGAPTALLRAFLLAMIDQLHPDLDYLRADPSAGEKARAERGAVAPPVVAVPQPVAVTVKPLVDRGGKNRRNTLTYDEQMCEAEASCIPCKLCGGKAKIQDAGPGWGYYIGCENYGQRKNECFQQGSRISGWAYNVADRWNELNAALTIQPADPLSDPRVKALVEAATKIARLQKSTLTNVRSAHSNRGAGASDWMREDDRDFMRDLENAFTSVTSALRAIGGEA